MNPQWQFNAMAIPLGISVFLILCLIVLALRKRHNRLAIPFLFFMGCLLLWMVTSLLEVLTLNLRLSLFMADLSFLGITFFSIAWLAVMMIYTGREKLFYRIRPYIIIVPIFVNVMIWTNPIHNLWRGESYRDLTTTWFPISFYDYGPLFYFVHIPFALSISFVAIYFLTVSLFFRQSTYRAQLSTLLIAFLLPLIIAILHLIGIQPIAHFNASPLVFPISAALTAWAVLGFGFLELTPIARDLVVENMLDLMVVLDKNNRIVDLNPAARNYLIQQETLESNAIIGADINALLPALNMHTEQIAENYHLQEDFQIKHNGKAHMFDVFISTITRNGGQNAGQLLIFHDITARKQAEQAVYDQIQELAIVNERQRVARELHDSVNQTLFAAGTLADLLPRAIEKKPEKIPEYATHIQQLIHGATAEMRLVLLELYPDALINTDLGVIIKHLCEAFTGVTGIEIDYTPAMQINLEKDAQLAFYRITQEALHNINKHAQATEVSIKLNKIENTVELLIQDNGAGFDAENVSSERFGLKNMIDRAKSVGAALNINSVQSKGTTIKLIGEAS